MLICLYLLLEAKCKRELSSRNLSSSIFDLTQTKVIGKLVKVLSWYDNEWAFSNRMLDTALAMMRCV